MYRAVIHLTHEPFLVPPGVVEPLDGQGQDVLHGQLAAGELLHRIVRVALLGEDLLVNILQRNFSVYKPL